jgi:hypothetical protein
VPGEMLEHAYQPRMMPALATERASEAVVPFRQQVGKAAPIALFVYRAARILAAGRAAGARDRACLAAPQGAEKVACEAVH